MSRPSGQRVVVGIQRPSADILPRDTSLQFNNRILLAPNSSDNDSKRMLFPSISSSNAYPLTENAPGAALFYKNQFIVPEPVYFPDMSSINIPRVVQRITKEVDPNWFIKEDYWEELY